MLDRHYISEALDSLDRSGEASLKMKWPSLSSSSSMRLLAAGTEFRISRAGSRNLRSYSPKQWRWHTGAVTTRKILRNRESKRPNSERRLRGQPIACLNQMEKIPGQGQDGRINAERLAAWLAEVRRLCRRACPRRLLVITASVSLLAKAPEGEDGVWPCRAVCEAMEGVASAEIGEGFHIGVLNSRGVHSRGEGGEQERELAAKYRGWAERLHFEYPYVGGVLEGIAASYDREAAREDSEAIVNKRLRY